MRQASASRGVSPATVFEAFYRLEAQGLIRARPRSGYYVAARPRRLSPEPVQPSASADAAREVAVSDLVFGILSSAASRDVLPLGSAFPSPLLFPLLRLGRALATTSIHLDPWSTVDNLTPGSLALRRQIALRYLIDGVRIDPEDIVVTNGAMEALNLALAATCRPGDAVVVESPCFYACLQALERHGLRAIEVATDPRTGIDLAALEQAIERHAPRACWLMTSFQNPLGSAMSSEKKRALVELLARRQLPLIEDDVYHELFFGRRPALAKACDEQGWVLHCSSFSKSLAPGYRIGWVAPGRFRTVVQQHKLTASLATSIPVQLALARYLERGSFERHLRVLRRSLETQRDQYLAAIARGFPAGTRVSRPTGGYFLWLELPDDVDAMALCRHAMAAGISLAPGPMFSASGAFRNCLRINFGHPFDARVGDALRHIGRWARS